MKMANNLPIHYKFLFMLFFPFAAVLYFSVQSVLSQYRANIELDNLATLSEFAIKASNLIHELQKERGASAVYLGSKA
ncbi:MAG: nitrate- and nitrite sensing domain-containing protein [Gammaproteobacteria bacterium]|nr:nitrate- and nitrite sensing domain-containing protein [Gammaproteobacteria bacterium]